MEKWIEDMLALQAIDMRVRRLRIRLQMLPEERRRLQEEQSAAADGEKGAKDSLRAVELEMREVEAEIGKHNDAINKLRQQSAMVKKNDEYKAMLSEIAGHQGKIGDLETRQIELLDKLDARKAELLDSGKSASAKSDGAVEELRGLEELEKELLGEIAAMEGRRQDMAWPIEPELLSKYERLLSRGKGEPLAPVRNGNCGNCHLQLTPQTLNIVKKSQCAACDNCGHMLYNPE